ncbi:MAG: tail fiber domain-containing protein, partial [Bacteroidota bacterium]
GNSAFGVANTAENGGNAIGRFNKALALNSSAFGVGAESDVYQMTVIGCYNEATNGSSFLWSATDPVFVVGNGQSEIFRSTALTILKNGNVGIGTTTPDELLDVNGKVKIGSLETLEDGGVSILSTNSSFLPTTDNQRDLGSSSRRWDDVFAVSGFVSTSDAKNKTNINSLDYGLEQVMQLKPVRFEWKGQKEKGEKIGFLAQDLLEVLPEVVKTHDWVESEEGDEKKKVAVENLGVYYSDIIPVLASAIQEQQEEIEEKEERIDELENRIGQLEKMMLELSKQPTESRSEQIDINSSKVQLLQNRPNPFKDYTEIGYYLPENINDAHLQISNAQGQVLERVELEGTGEGSVLLETNQLANGYYQYALVING